MKPGSLLTHSWITLCVLALVATIADAQGPGVIAGPNVNMVSGTVWPDGDPFLQRQNEPSIAVSTRNPLHLMAASNDYRTVDLPGVFEGLPIADSWIGVYTSLDGGGSWTSTLLPCYPYESSPPSPRCVASPIAGLEAGADPVIRAGTHGMFYLSGIVFDRGVTPQSKLFVARYIDLNNDPANPIQYIDTVEVASYPFPSNVFIDKPWLAVDVPGSSPWTETFLVEQEGNPASPVSQQVECGNLYLAWAEIESIGDTVVEALIKSSTSIDCGDTWSTPQVLSDPGTIGQGATVAVSPNPGHVYMAWRQLSGLGVTGDCSRGGGFWKNHLDDWPFESVVLGGVTYTKAEALAVLNLPTQGDMPCTVIRHLLAAKLNQLEIDPGAADLMSQADSWLVANPLGSKPKKGDKDLGSALATALETFNDGLLGPIVCGVAPPGSSDDAIIVTASTNGGGSFDPPSVVRQLDPWKPFDQGTTPEAFRTTAYPTMTVDADGRVYIAWSERGEALPTADPDPVEGDSRIMVGTSSYPFATSPWADVTPIDRPEIPGHQIQPTITFVNDHLFLVYNDFRKDYSGVFDRFVMDYLTPTQPYRHTVDIRAAVADPGPSPVFTDYSVIAPSTLPARPSTQASRYLFIPTIQGGVLVFEQLQFNPPNLPMFKAGTVPFYGDYIDVAGSPPFIPDGFGGWTHNTGASVEPVAHAAWTDNRNVVGPPDGDWTSFVPLGIGGPSKFEPGATVLPCDPNTDDVDRTRMRNQDIYTSRLTTGLYVAVPGNSRPLSDLFQRGFVVFVQNGTDTSKSFSLEILSPPGIVEASFDQFSVVPVTYEEIDLAAYSSASRTVFATSTDATASIEILVSEIDPLTRLPISGGLEQSVLINPDPTNPQPSDPALLSGEVYTPAVLNPAVYNPAVYNPAVLNPAVFNPAVFNPAVFNPAVFNDAVLNYSVANPAVFNPAVLNPAVYNPAVFNPAVFNQAVLALGLMNPAVYNPAVLNPAVFNPAVLNPAVFNPAVFNPAVLNPAVLNPAVFNPAVFNPAVLNPAVMNPAVLNPAVYNTTFADGSATDFNLVAFNGGNAPAAYSLNLSLLNQLPGFQYQLMINRVYFTPVANDCELTEAAQQELLVNQLDPDLSADLLDPESDATFYLDPNDYVVITLRITPDPNAPVPGDPADFNLEDLSASVVAQAVNPADAALGETQPAADTFLAENLSLLEIAPTALPDGDQNIAYPAQALIATGGVPPYLWSLAPGSGPLPLGMTLSSGGVIDGTPTAAGTFDFTVRVTDLSQIDEKSMSLTIDPAAGTVTFEVQPGSTTSGQLIPSFAVKVADGTGSPLPGITVDLAIGDQGCPTGTLAPASPTTTTNPQGIATFFFVVINGGGYGYTLEATASPDGVSDITVESVPFDVDGICQTISMGTARVGATMTTLPDGRILVAGGVDVTTNTPLASAEIYDPETDTWSVKGMYFARSGHTATLLASGRVLITGGSSDPLPATTALASTEFFDPDYAGGTGGFGYSPSRTLTVPRMGHTATRLGNGQVLFVGGRSTGSGPFLASAEVCEFNMSGFTATTGAPTARDSHTATLLNDGRVLLVGGLSAPSTYLSTAEIYDPATDSFGGTGGMSSARLNHTATRLSDGRVLITGGTDGISPASLSTAEIFDPAAAAGIGSFGATGGMSSVRQLHTATRLDNGRVLVMGGTTASSGLATVLGSAELFDPFALGGSGAFASTHSMATARYLHRATLFADGGVMVAGGYGSSGGLAEAEILWPEKDRILWARQFGSAGYEQPLGVAVGTSGVYVAGWTTGQLPGQTSPGGRDAFLRKYDTSGNEVWTRQFGSVAEDSAWDVAMDASGVYVAGRAGYYLPGQPWFGSSDAFVRKYDFDGNEVWTRQFGTTATDEATSVSVDATGVYVVGNAQDAFPGHTHEGLIDVFVRKYDTDGTEGWTHQFGSVGSDWASGVSVGASGVYVAGGTSDALPGQIHEGGWDAFAHKCDLAGNPLWTRQFGTAEADEAPGISVDASGAYVAGATLGVLPGQTSSGSRDAFIRKYDATGAEVWTRQFGGTGNDRFFDVSVDASGVYLSGFTGGRLPGQSGGGTGDAFVRMYDFDGAGLWTQQFGTSAWDLSYAVSVGASGAYAAGETSGTLPGQTSSGGYDAFLVRFAPPPALQVAAGGAYSCGLRTDGAVVCWGVDSRGQASPPAETFTQVAAGALFTCGLKTDGSLACWGWDGEPQIDPPAGTFTQVTVGNAHACGLEADGSVVCWGADSYGGATPPAGTFTQIDAGSYHTCGVETGGSVVCWGYNVSGQASPPSGTFTQVAAGGHHSCAIQLGGSVVCWGSDTRGESTPPADTFTHISAGTGQGHTCGLKAGGSVICWGDDVFGQSTPYVDSFTQVSAGDNHSCGVRIEGSVICWGNDNYGQSTTPPPLQ